MKKSDCYRDEARVRHMFQALDKVLEKSRGLSRADLVEGEDNTELIIHYLTILGEAANNVSSEFCSLHPEVDFKNMAGLRHKLVHDYANIDMDVIWEVVTCDVPSQYPLLKALCDSIPAPQMPGNVDEFR